MTTNRPAGEIVSLAPGERPQRAVLEGTNLDLEPLDKKHYEDLYQNIALSHHDHVWDYMPVGPFESKQEFFKYLEPLPQSKDPFYFAVVKKDGECVGLITFLNIVPQNRSIEVGHVTFSPKMQRTTISTEAQYIMAKYVFDTLQYRRYEWKCNNLNAPSKTTAERLGFKFEGLFRKHMIIKGRNRDTAWFSMTDDDWPLAKQAFGKYLEPNNFEGDGTQKQGLKGIRERLSLAQSA